MFVALNTNLLRSKNHPGYVAELHSVFTSAINMKDVTIVKNNPRVQMLGRIESTGVDVFFFLHTVLTFFLLHISRCYGI